MTYLTVDLIKKHSDLARKAGQNEQGINIARFNAKIAIELNILKNRNVMVITDGLFDTLRRQAHDFAYGVKKSDHYY